MDGRNIIMKYKVNILYVLLITCIGSMAVNVGSSYAVDEPNILTVDKKIKYNNGFAVEKIPSLFFTYWQHRAIIDAKRSRGVVRPPTQAELDALESGEDFIVDPGPRDIILSGIVYTTKNDWVIWLNGKRIMPDAVPKEVLDLRVFKDYIEIKWLDDYTNQIFPLRLRAHQRFNMDNRIFLPG